MPDVLKQLQAMSVAPSEPAAFDAWLNLEDAIAFLEANAQQDEFVLYAGTPHCFMHAILVPNALVAPPDVDDLMEWNCNARSSWGITQSFNPSKIYLSPPLDHTGSKTLDQGEQLVYARHFEGRLGDRSYFEILQKFVHVSGLHFMAERNAYCRLDARGDIEEVIRIVKMPDKSRPFPGSFITVSRQVMDEYMALTGSVAVRTFDFTRFHPSAFGSWTRAADPQYVTRGELSYRFVIEPGNGSYMRGFQIVRPVVTKEVIAKRLDRSEPEDRNYESFIAIDGKNKVVREISTAPGATAITSQNLTYPLR